MQNPMISAFVKMMTNYANFNGRTSRADFWWAYLAQFLLGFVVGFIGGLLGEVGAMIGFLFSLALVIPSLALVWRRLHDIGKSGAYYFIAFIPIVGAILLLIALAKPGDRGDNMYGPNPTSNFGY